MSAAKAKRRRRYTEVEPRSEHAAEEAPYIWTTKAALNRIRDKIFDSTTLAVYVALVWLQNNSGRREFYASLNQIASYAGCGERTVERKLDLLRQHKLIGVVSGVRGRAMHEANRYIIGSTRSAKVAEPLRQDGEEATPMNPNSTADSKEPQTWGSITTASPLPPFVEGGAASREGGKDEHAWL